MKRTAYCLIMAIAIVMHSILVHTQHLGGNLDASECKDTPYTKADLTICIVAHQDDWQLFFMPQMYNAIKASSMGSGRVVIIYVTAGTHSTDDWARVGTRQLGATYSTVFVANTPVFTSGERSIIGISGLRIVNNHVMATHECRSTMSYYMQIMTPCQTTLRNMYQGTNETLNAMNGGTTYSSWVDVSTTIMEIIKAEMNPAIVKNAVIVTHDNKKESEHLEHVGAAQLAVTARHDLQQHYNLTMNMYETNYTVRLSCRLKRNDTINQAMTYGAQSVGMTYFGHEQSGPDMDSSHTNLIGYRSPLRVYKPTETVDDPTWPSPATLCPK